MKTRNVYIVGGARIPFMKSMTAYRDVSSEELMTASLKSLVDRYNLEGKTVGDVALGAVMHSSANWNLAREVVQSSGLHQTLRHITCNVLAERAWKIRFRLLTKFLATKLKVALRAVLIATAICPLWLVELSQEN